MATALLTKLFSPLRRSAFPQASKFSKLMSVSWRCGYFYTGYVRMPACSIRPHTYEVSAILFSWRAHLGSLVNWSRISLVSCLQGMSYDRMLEIRKCNVTPGYNRPNEAPLLIHQVHILPYMVLEVVTSCSAC